MTTLSPSDRAPSPSVGGLVRLFVLTFVLFFVVLLVFERIPEFGLDVDFKPFFIPIALLAILASNAQAWAIGLAVASSELVGDFFEPGGVEPDDPIGFFGYLVGALACSAVIQGQWQSPVRILLGGLTYALVQGLMEAAVWMALGEFATDSLISVGSNIVTHGLIGGALLAWPFARAFHKQILAAVGVETRA